MINGMEYPFGDLALAVLSLSPPSLLSTLNLLLEVDWAG